MQQETVQEVREGTDNHELGRTEWKRAQSFPTRGESICKDTKARVQLESYARAKVEEMSVVQAREAAMGETKRE